MDYIFRAKPVIYDKFYKKKLFYIPQKIAKKLEDREYYVIIKDIEELPIPKGKETVIINPFLRILSRTDTLNINLWESNNRVDMLFKLYGDIEVKKDIVKENRAYIKSYRIKAKSPCLLLRLVNLVEDGYSYIMFIAYNGYKFYESMLIVNSSLIRNLEVKEL